MHHREKAKRLGRLVLGRVGVVEIKAALMFGRRLVVRAIGVIEVEVTTSHLVRHSFEVIEGVRYFVRHYLETEGFDEVVDKDWSDDALGIFVVASHSVVFRKFDKDRFDGALDVSRRHT